MYIPIPSGIKVGWGGTIASVPKGFLFCNGQAVSRTQFANLFAAISTIWGVGDGSTTFNIPDCRNRVQMGADVDVSCKPTSSVIGGNLQCGGSACHYHSFSAITSGHTHYYSGSTSGHCHYISSITVSGNTSGHTHNFSNVSGTTDTYYPGTLGVECYFSNACYPSDGNSHSHGFSGLSGTTDSNTDYFSGSSSGSTDSNYDSYSGTTDSAGGTLAGDTDNATLAPPFAAFPEIIKV